MLPTSHAFLIYTLLICGEQVSLTWSSEEASTKPPGLVPLKRPESAVKFKGELKMKQMKNSTKMVGGKHRFYCDITGSPVPTYRWFKDGILITANKGRVSHRSRPFGSVLRIDVVQQLDKGAYTCVAQNKAKKLNTTAYLNVIPRDPNARAPNADKKNRKSKEGKSKLDLLDSQAGFCEKFRSTVCKKFLGDSLVYVHHKRFQGLKEEQLSKLIEEVTMESEEKCGQLLVEASCYYNFPRCDRIRQTEIPRRLCKEDCISLTTKICPHNYLNLVNGDAQRSILLNCSTLPSSKGSSSSPCISMGLQIKVEEEEEEEMTIPEGDCYQGRGEKYKGQHSSTFTGKNCLPWKIVSEFENEEGAFCRNPQPDLMQSPWCYTENLGLKAKEFCNVPKCPPSMFENRSSSFETAPIIAVVGVLLSLSFIALLVCCFWRRVGNAGYTGFKKVEKPQEMQPQPTVMPISVPEYALNKIRFGELLGQGLFGPVYRAKLYGEVGPSPVIIKTLQPSMNETHAIDFRREASTLCELAHPSVTAVVGVSMNSSPRCIIFETLSQGDLHEYLLYHSPAGCCSETAAALYAAGGGSELSFGPPMTLAEQLQVASQVAAALDYLSDHHFVHRDISARNVVVGEGLVCKLADFAASRDMYANDYFRANGPSCASLLPIRWMAPESIMFGKFTPESDMWSYGILLWEIWSFGMQPFLGYSNAEVLKMARSHQILQCPSECPAKVYNLMAECWNELPQHRPRAKEVVKRVRNWHTEAVATEAVLKQQQQQAHSHSHSSGHTSSTAFSGSGDARRDSNSAPNAKTRLLPPMGMPLRPPVAPPPTTRELNGASPVPSTLSGDSMEGHSGGTYIPSQGHIV